MPVINTPSITPTNPNSLLWASTQGANNITHPTAGEVVGPWTGAAGGIAAQFETMSEYVLSASSNTPVNYTQSPSGTWDGMAVAFYIGTGTQYAGFMSYVANPSRQFTFIQTVENTASTAETVSVTINGVGSNSLIEVVFVQSISSSKALMFTNGSSVLTSIQTLVVGDIVYFQTTGTLPTNFSSSVPYYVITTGLSGTQFEVSATPGGSAIVAGSPGSGTHTYFSGRVTDNHGNTYTMTPQSPYGPVPTIADKFIAGIAYALIGPSGSTTFTWLCNGVATAIFCGINVTEYSYIGTIAFVKDYVQTYPHSTLVSSPSVLPVVTPINQGSLLLATWITDQGAQGTAGAPWITDTTSNVFGSYYILCSMGTIAASFPDSTVPDSAGTLIAVFF